MKILVNGKQTVLKAGSSFEYRSENPLFTDSEDYSLEIEFPMKDCPQNIDIFGALHVKGVDISTVTFSCEIITESFDKTGFLTITEVNEVGVKAQFLEGMSTQNYNTQGLDMYIDEIDYSLIDGTNGDTSVVLDDDEFCDLPVWDKDEDKVFEIMNSQPLNRHIYLKSLVEWIAFQAGLDVDTSAMEASSAYGKLVVCNTTDNVTYVPNVWQPEGQFQTREGFYFMNLGKTLPHWTVQEFFEHLGKLFGCKPIANTLKKEVYMAPVEDMIERNTKINLTVNDDFTVEMQDSEQKLEKVLKVKFPDDCNPGNINNCPWIYDYLDKLKVVNLRGTYNMEKPEWLAQNPYADDIYYRKSRLYEAQLHGLGGIYTAITEIEKRDDLTAIPDYQLHFIRFEVLNQFMTIGDCEELKIYPANIEWKRLNHKYLWDWAKFGRNTNGKPDWVASTSTFALPYKMPVISIIKYRPTELVSENTFVYNAGALIDGGEPEVKVDNIQLVIYDKSDIKEDGTHMNTRTFEPQIGTEYAQETITATEGLVPNYNIGIDEYSDCMYPLMFHELYEDDVLPQVDDTKLYKYKFLSKTLPDPKAIYVIKGKEYACLRLTAHFTVDGMSELIEGEFYEIVG